MAAPIDLTKMYNQAILVPTDYKNHFALAEGYIKHYNTQASKKRPRKDEAELIEGPECLMRALKHYYLALLNIKNAKSPANSSLALNYSETLVNMFFQVFEKISARQFFYKRAEKEVFGPTLPTARGLTSEIFRTEFGLSLREFKNFILGMQDLMISLNEPDHLESYHRFLRTFGLGDEIKNQKLVEQPHILKNSIPDQNYD